MASPEHPSETQQRAVKTKKELPDEVAEIVAKSLKVGAGTGACGLLFGATSGIVVGTTPVLFSLVSGFQWFGLGSIYYGTRSFAIARYGPGHQATPSQKVEASALGGAISGMAIGGLLRGPKNVLPGGLVFSLLGAGGQLAVNKWTGNASPETKSSSWLNSKWSPMRRLTDQEYESMLEEKLLRLEAEIAIIDENIAGLIAQKKERDAFTKQQPPTTTSNKP